TLADGAAAYAEQCVWAHSDERINVGENLYASTDLSSGIDEGAEMWANEYQFYNFISRSCAPGEQCGHYTQMVWFDSILVGCGDAVCEPLRLPNGSTQYASAVNVVCWYAAAGNLTGHDPYDTDGGNPANTPDYDHSTMKLTMPYMLLWHPDNLVQAYELELSLAAGPSI
ncbi:MAG: hypothetical protein GY842_21585, partial [bacterium]|nr:hypothetical protein [bacterium]